MKDTNAIDKIITKEAVKDYLAMNPKLPNGKPKYKTYHPYTISDSTNEARQVKIDYLNDIITEEGYKAYCLKYNLRSDTQ